MKTVVEEILNYMPFNEEEDRDKMVILDYLSKNEDAFYRENKVSHMTASGWIVNKEKTKVLMAYHNIYHSWSWLGGHADGNEDLLSVAMKEAKEESGVEHIRPLLDSIFSLEILSVDGHYKNGEYVPTHTHMNVTYLLEADENDPVFIKQDENSAVGWFTLDEAVAASSEPWMKEHVYSKLNAKLRKMQETKEEK
ncbi:MAG: NUDIX hydrolase [Erysipelotrichaceae bacterium]|nr:NUDIX hydrolase [Erysipelotrichaceae bacterium]